MTNDIVNGSFELLGGLFLLLNCVILCRDKQVRGVSVWPFVFYSLWGFWNLWYYPSLGQWFSFFGGIVVVSANAVWVLLHWYFSKYNKARQPPIDIAGVRDQEHTAKVKSM